MMTVVRQKIPENSGEDPVKRVLWILDDDCAVRGHLVEILSPHFETQCFGSLRELHAAIKLKSPPALILADMTLRDGTMISFLSNNTVKVAMPAPFVILSGADDEQMLRSAFLLGARDFIMKPFSNAELVVKCQLFAEEVFDKVAGEKFNSVLRAPFFEIDFMNHLVSRDGKAASVTPIESRIVACLVKCKDMGVDRTALLLGAWPGEIAVNRGTLDVHLARIRAKLRVLGIGIKSGPQGYVLSDLRLEAAQALQKENSDRYKDLE